MLTTPPPRVLLHFSEGVETAFGSVRVFDSRAHRVDDGRISRPAHDEVAVSLPKLMHDTYTVAWRVVSADSHPVHGAFVFHVGNAGGTGVAAQVLGEGGSQTVAAAFDVVRFLSFALILLVGGGAASLALVVVPSRARRQHRNGTR